MADERTPRSRRLIPSPVPRKVARLLVQRRSRPGGAGFLILTRFVVRNQYEDGSLSRPYRFEMVERRGMDSVAVIPFLRKTGRILIVVKAGFRPALFLRGSGIAPGEGLRPRPLTIEAVAGSLEPGEVSLEAVRASAARELREETGYSADPGDLFALGAGFFPSHGQCTEKIHLFGVALSGKAKSSPKGDGSVNEADSWNLVLEARDLLRRCRAGEIEDPKLEIGVSRLLDSLRTRRRGER